MLTLSRLQEKPLQEFAYYCPGCKKRIWRPQLSNPPRHIESFCTTVGYTTRLRLSRNQQP